MSNLENSEFPQPQGFKTCVRNIGVKNTSKDFVVIVSSQPCTSAAVYTQSLFAGESVKISREHLAQADAQAIVTVSKNANVATGDAGKQDALQLIGKVGEILDLPAEKILISSTGVIGRRYPIEKMMANVSQLSADDFIDADFKDAAEAIMTTDTLPKFCSKKVGNVTITGIAKGVGMIEPNMATLLTYFMTDAAIDKPTLTAMFKRVMDKSFNSLSVDSDTSTSDSAVILANGAAGEVDLVAFEQALQEIAIFLVKMIARDGEGSTKLMEVTVTGARDDAQAKRIAKSIVNSPLVKTAVHGSDPNWGRIAMAIGKCHEETDIKQDNVKISFSDVEVFPRLVDEAGLQELKALMSQEDVFINVDLGVAQGASKVWGCDLSDGYIRINADYTT